MENYCFARYRESVINNMEWTNEKYLNFIEDYKNATVLWDIKNPNYKNNGKKRKVLKALGQKYGMDEDSLRKKIKNLRSAFHREHHRLNNKMKGEEQDDDDIRKWFAYDALRFILDVTGPFMAKVYGWMMNVPGAITLISYVINKLVRIRFMETCKDQHKRNCNTGLPRIYLFATKREELLLSTEDSFHQDEPEEDFDVSTQYIQLPQLMDQSERPKSPEHVQTPIVNKEEDEYDLFGRSMTVQLRKLPELVALELMQKMQFMVFSARKQLSKERNKRKLKLVKQAKQAHNLGSTSKRKVVPSTTSQISSPTNSPTGFKFEILSAEADTRECDASNRDFTYEYVTTIENIEHYAEDKNDNPASSVMKRELKRKSSKSIDPLEVKQHTGTRIKHE